MTELSSTSLSEEQNPVVRMHSVLSESDRRNYTVRNTQTANTSIQEMLLHQTFHRFRILLIMKSYESKYQTVFFLILSINKHIGSDELCLRIARLYLISRTFSCLIL